MTLTPEQERFAAEAVAQGLFRDLNEVVRAGIDLVRRAQAERAAFIASLEAAEAEGERDGFLDAEDVHAEISAMIEEMARTPR
ncbi:ribbon-helix-helix domain-containing protein [Plastoroseomonas hellenica]|uniref:Type II toxin-antitoxin system ParD family antitoxin n=1 Tax=Plastoroseomonas hellenica TaxID=2687306 RepID=A0ABS5EVN6_9PROT|nr:type II toxin-antitoxin system ParD family antitoxin [Plastoroseomonas hellenica]MBR0641360.1 type II toxin-antitoxin system ParD family antitoxin [Plastoroseomonas hellenica]MBR0664360.1 type II toxin-antitoxin system ParD family antitoxin [Plastoroseomonas hellenica]